MNELYLNPRSLTHESPIKLNNFKKKLQDIDFIVQNLQS